MDPRGVTARSSVGIAPLPGRRATPSKRLWPWLLGFSLAVVAAILGVWLVWGRGNRAPVTAAKAANPQGMLAEGVFPPSNAAVALTSMRSNSGWILNVHLKGETAPQSIGYRIGHSGPFTSTGTNPHDLDPETLEPRVQRFFTIERIDRPTTFEIQYVDHKGARRGPFPVEFDPMVESIKQVKHHMQIVPNWVEFVSSNDKLRLYFSWLLSNKKPLAAIRYGVDTMVPTRSLGFSPSTELGVARDDQIYIELPTTTRFVSVQVEFRDGSRSEVRRFTHQQ